MRKKMKSKFYDILIIGGGPAGLAAAAEIVSESNKKVLIVEMGSPLILRSCPAHSYGNCISCDVCGLMGGLGGASGLLGGKLCFFPAGDRIADHVGYNSSAANHETISFFNKIGFKHLIPPSILNSSNADEVNCFILKTYYSLPLLKTDLNRLFAKMISYIYINGGEIQCNSEAIDIKDNINNDFRFTAIVKQNDALEEIFVKDSIIIATGRSSVNRMHNIFSTIICNDQLCTVDVGVRVVMPSQNAASTIPNLQDPKLKLREGQASEARTLCWTRGGELSLTNIDGILLVDGHFGDEITQNTSVSLVSRLNVPDGYLPLDYARNLISVHDVDGPFIARESLASFMKIQGLKSNLNQSNQTIQCKELKIKNSINSEVYENAVELLHELNRISGGTILENPIGDVYAPVIDNFWGSPILDNNLMTPIEGLYIAGDITGLGRGIVQGIFCGIISSRAILQKVHSNGITRSGHGMLQKVA